MRSRAGQKQLSRMLCVPSVAPLSKTLPGQSLSSSPQSSLEVSTLLQLELYVLAALRAEGQGQRSVCSPTRRILNFLT